MLNAIRPLIDSGIINEDTRQAISEAWEARLAEAKETARSELREEFSRRYNHDKSVMVEALDKLVTESLSGEIKEFAADKQALAEDRVKYKNFVRESGEKFNKFLVSKLAEELKELRQDRSLIKEGAATLDKFVVSVLSEEISEFAKDKRDVVETKVRLVAEGKKKLAEMQQKFITRSAKLVKESVTKNLHSEMSQLKEDIQIARENMFGRRLFEAFASEFTLTHLNENKEISKLRTALKVKDRQLAETVKKTIKATQIAESKEKEIRVIKESASRNSALTELLKPLNKEKAAVMSELLENVSTGKLQSAYDKYLPAVLNNSGIRLSEKTTLNESRSAVTGNKSVRSQANTENTDNSNDNVVELKRLAGLK